MWALGKMVRWGGGRVAPELGTSLFENLHAIPLYVKFMPDHLYEAGIKNFGKYVNFQ